MLTPDQQALRIETSALGDQVPAGYGTWEGGGELTVVDRWRWAARRTRKKNNIEGRITGRFLYPQEAWL